MHNRLYIFIDVNLLKNLNVDKIIMNLIKKNLRNYGACPQIYKEKV